MINFLNTSQIGVVLYFVRGQFDTQSSGVDFWSNESLCSRSSTLWTFEIVPDQLVNISTFEQPFIPVKRTDVISLPLQIGKPVKIFNL